MITSTESWEIAIANSLQNLWIKVIGFTPALFGAIIVFIVGLMIAVSLGVIITKLMQKIRVDKAADEIGLTHLLKRGDINSSISTIVGATVKWFLIVVFLMAATDILNLPQITQFLNQVLLFIPNVIVASMIIAISVIIANFVEHVVVKGGKATNVTHNKFLGKMSRWAILIFGIMAALIQIGIAVSLVETLFTGFIAMISIAGGLAFGLGGKKKAGQVLEKLGK